MTTPACRFDKDRVCLTHSYKGVLEKHHYAAACDIGLAALRAQLEEILANNGKLHSTVREQARVIGRLQHAVTDALKLLEEARAQWGEDYLWKKWEMSEAIADIKALSTEPKEALG